MLSVRIEKRLRDFPLNVHFALDCSPCLALIGLTGCGKSMTLRSIAGLERPDAGRIVCGDRALFDSESGIDLSPERRRVGVVFQDYALFPHMTVLDNILYGPRARRMPQREAQSHALAALDQLDIASLASERPTRLSGGQRQRVALARAIATDPLVLLLDEPMSALDTRTRRRVRFELRALIERIGIPTVAVTHDPEDALTLGDQVCVMHDGHIVQSGDRRELIQRPRSQFLAEFMGLNLMRGHGTPLEGGLSEVACGDLRLRALGVVTGPACLTVRPADVRLGCEPVEEEANQIRGLVTSLSYTGQAVRVTVENQVVIYCEIDADSADRIGLSPGLEVTASFDPRSANCYEEEDD